jgi:hypothetical protein
MSHNIPAITAAWSPVNYYFFVLVPYGPTLIKNPGREQASYFSDQPRIVHSLAAWALKR